MTIALRVRAAALLIATVGAVGAWAFPAFAAVAAGDGAGADAAAPAAMGPRVEARSAQLLAVGTVHGERMIIHLSRIEDNAPVRDAQINVLLRGTTHAAVADADGSYSVESPDFALPGAAAVQFQVTWAGARQDLQGTLQGGGPAQANEGGSSRQVGWWILNFAVCIGFLWLWSRRKRRHVDEPAP